MVASAKGSYDAQDEAVRHTAAKLLLLDRVLSNYGPETKEAREMLRRIIASRVAAIWPEDRFKPIMLDAPEAAFAAQEIETRIIHLSPNTDIQRRLQSEALQIFSDITETRWLNIRRTRQIGPRAVSGSGGVLAYNHLREFWPLRPS